MEHDIRLEDIGWKVLKERQVNLEKFTRQAIRQTHEADGHVQVLDLAMGSGRHLMELLRSFPELDIRAELRDADPTNLENGRQLANKLGLTRIRFASGDAFAPQDLDKLNPNVVLAAGLFELTADNHRIAAALDVLAAGMRPQSCLVYTDQPHHPHLEMIGRVAVQREESPWAMRRRSIETMNEILTAAGFKIQDQSTDEHGLFTVGLAIR